MKQWGWGLFAACTVFMTVLSANAEGEAFKAAADAYRAQSAKEVRDAAPEAGDAFDKASEAELANRLDEATAGYEEAARLAPDSPHPLRRLCKIKMLAGDRDGAILFCRQALAKRNDAVQKEALAIALLSGSPSERDKSDARYLADQAVQTGADAGAYLTLCQASIATQSDAGLSRCVAGLERLAPDEWVTHMFAALEAAGQARWNDAEASLQKARSLGAPPEDVDKLAAEIDDARPATDKYLGYAGWFLLAWLATLVTLVIAGFALSGLTMRAAYDLPPERTGRPHGTAALLRRLYSVVIAATCIFYYASIPIAVATVVIGGGGVIYLFFAIGRIPVQLVFVVGVATVVTVWTTLRSLFVSVRDEDPGMRLDLTAHPKLDALLSEVAGRVGTRKVDTVFLTPGTEIAVFERNGFLRALRGAHGERCLILGAGVLQGMKLLDLKAILAHEYGHFQNEDTAGGALALQVRRSALKLAIGLAQGGVATWYNPAWWMVKGFFSLFLRISHGASRLQEVLADRWAAFSYGADAFERGLTHAIRAGVRFPPYANAALNEAVSAKAEVKNLYRHKAADAPNARELEEEVDEALNREPSAYDSHPAPKERFELVRRLDAPTPEGEDREAKAWSVFEGRRALEQQLTAELLDRVRSAIDMAA